jgi:putative PIN family toxin of toxin-antitoxin system
MKVVLDTNVLVSALLNPNGLPAGILNLVLEGTVSIVYDNRILSEYRDVLHRKKFAFDVELIRILMDFIIHEGVFTNALPLAIPFKDEDDKKFYEVFKSASIDFLITGNKKDFPEEKNILTPKEYMDINYPS